MQIPARHRGCLWASFFYAAGVILAPTVCAEEKAPALSSETAVQQESLPPAEKKIDTSTVQQSKPFDLWTSKTMTSNWGGVRTDLENVGITLQLTYQQQFMVNTLGGLETKNGNDFAASYDGTLLLDFGKMKLIPGGEFFFRYKGTSGGEISDFDREKIGGLSRTNADAGTEEPIFVDKWWWRQRLFDDRLELRLGLFPTAKDILDVSKVANSEDTQFMNQSLILNRGIAHFKGLGFYMHAWPTDWLYVKAAVVDAGFRERRTGFDSAFHDRHDGSTHFGVIYEVGAIPNLPSPNGKMAGNYRIGSWYNPNVRQVYTNTRDGAIIPENESGDVGIYLGADQMVFKETNDPKDTQGLTVFARYAATRGHINQIEHAWSTGAQYVGLIPTRDKDVLGFAVAQSILSRQLRSTINSLADRETVYELYYAYELTPWCVISPDFQVVTNPGGDKNDRDTFVAGLRLRLTF